MDLTSRALEILRSYPLCDSCLGRLFAAMGHGIENHERGRSLKNVIHMKLVYEYRNGADVLEDLKALAKVHAPTRRFLASNGAKVEEAACYICGGLLSNIERLAEPAAKALEGIEYNTFQVGSVVPREITQREQEIMTKLGVETGETIKHEINRRVGKALVELVKRPVSKERPDVVAMIDVVSGAVRVARNPILLAGRYLKLSRTLAQSRMVPEARDVMERVLDPIREKIGGSELVVHAAGREDVDVRMLGNGRPLVVEVKGPAKYRDVPSGFAADSVIVTGLRPAARNDVRELKSRAKTSIKLYRALVLSDKPLAAEDFAKLKELEGAVVVQRTPRRIKRLSPRLKRRRMVYNLAARPIAERVFELFIRCQGGLYVKEFIHGDGGRTRPSVASILGAAFEVIELDVLDVE